MITVHHLENSRSQRVLWLLEELQVPYDIVRYERNKKTMLAPPELKKIHPLGKSPVIVDRGTVVAETGAILEHLLEQFGNGALVPAPSTPERRRYAFWMHYAEGSAMPWLFLKLVMSRIAPGSPLLVRPLAGAVAKTVIGTFVDPQLKTHVDFWENELAERDYFAGNEFTAADIQMSFPVEAGAQRAYSTADRPRLRAYLERIHARPAYKRALERGGPYAYA
ncbi:MAG: glutathione S-transferase [Proteobacteria bacterium]|nr:MAG: glutathione S-transferase [Pseudomonadota bacterium]